MKTVAESDDAAFADVSIVEVTMELTTEECARAATLMTENSWLAGEGWRVIVATGLAYLEGKAELDNINRPDLAFDVQKNLDNLLHRAMDLQAQYSVMKFKAFRFMQDTRVLQFNASGLRGELAMTEGAISRLQKQVDALKLERQQLLDENQRLRAGCAQEEPATREAPAANPPDEAPSSTNRNLLKRLLGRD